MIFEESAPKVEEIPPSCPRAVDNGWRSERFAKYLGPVTRAVTVTDLPRLNVGRLAQRGYLEPGTQRLLGWRVEGELVGPITITATRDSLQIVGIGSLRELRSSISLDFTDLTYGRRPWFKCPTCARRCAILTVEASGLHCTQCSTLPYLSASLGRARRRLLRREDLARRCGTTVADNRPVRPAWMRATRWEQLLAEYRAAELAVIADIQQRTSC